MGSTAAPMISPAEALAPTQTEFGSSRLAELQRCPTAHNIKYTQGIVPRREAVYFGVGRITHAGLRYVNEGVIAGVKADWRDVIAEAQRQRNEAILQGDPDAPVPWDELDPITEAERLLECYYASHGEENGGWPEGAKLLHTEYLLEDTELRQTARADLILDLGGEMVLPDTKSRQRALPEDRDKYIRHLRTKEQFLRLSALAQKHFGLAEPPAVWLDAIIKTKIAKVDRLLVRFTQADVDRWRHNAANMAIVESTMVKLPVVQNFNACAPEVGSPCWAFDYCWGTAEMRERKFKQVTEIIAANAV